MKIRLLSLLLFAATISHADEGRIVIKQKSGGQTILELAQHPVITFSGEDMVVTSDITTINIPIDAIDSYAAYDETSDIELPSVAQQLANGRVVFHGLSNDAEVRVYAMDGQLVDCQQANVSGHASISLSTFPKGTYIISTPDRSIKIINK